VLDQANAEFEDRGDTMAVRDYAYIATRKFQLADVRARTEVDRQQINEAARLGVVLRDEQVSDARAALASTRDQLQRERMANDAATSVLLSAKGAQARELALTESQLDREQQARRDGDGRHLGRLGDLAAIAGVKEDLRGVIITLNGSALFPFGSAILIDSGRSRLDRVAEALKVQSDDKRMAIEGHTDSHGSDAANVPLSRSRALAVRDYLISRGVESGKLTAVGMGSSRPLLDNTNPENRASNRRVEIVIHGDGLTTR
jgi:outer membrane protein OmpA-like peptidoglycan-associated protein